MSNLLQAEEIRAGLEEESAVPTDNDAEWIELCRNAYRTSTDYLKVSLAKQWEKNIAHFRSKHAQGSKYYGASFKHRSKIFRPKTRSVIRRHEAAATMAYFATKDAVNITPENESDKNQIISAAINKEILNYRLDRDVKWFIKLIGAYQDSMNIGAVVSYQHWEFKERITKKLEQVYDEAGRPVVMNGLYVVRDVEKREILKDKLAITLRPIENVRIDPASDWADPVQSSPYLIDMMPMYVHEIKARMKPGGNDGQEPWREMSDEKLMSAMKHEYDSVRKEREGANRQDSKAQNGSIGITDFNLVWVHRNFIRKDDQDYVYYTLGTEFMLSEPKTIEKMYHQSYRPYVMGNCVLETHRLYPSGVGELGEQLQIEANETANSRIDNIRLLISKRFYARRGAMIDFNALQTTIPGSVTFMDDINGDVREEKISDVTGSSYAEQDRLNSDFDEVTGAFSPSSLQTNRALNETVGGMEMLSSDANVMSEYQLRVFNETWVQPVLIQCMNLIKRYETDENIMAIAGQRANLMKRHKIEKVDWRMMQGPTTLRVAVGFGATNPRKRIEDLTMALGTIGKFMPNAMMKLDERELISEVFGVLGHEDGAKFFMFEDEGDPRIQQLQRQLQQMQQIIQTKQAEQHGKIQVEQLRQQGQSEREQMKIASKDREIQIKAQLESLRLQLDAETNEMARSELLLQQNALLHEQKLSEIQILQQERDSITNQKIQSQTASAINKAESSIGDNKTGVIARKQYGNVPFAEG